MSKNVEHYGYRTIHEKMDAHVKRENARANPRRAGVQKRDKNGKFMASNHDPATDGKRVRRNAIVFYPYGGKPGETIVRPGGFRARQAWKDAIQKRIDQVGQQVAREASHARPGCALVTVHANQATALAYKLRAALKGGQLRDYAPGTVTARKGVQVRNTGAKPSELYIARTEGVLYALEYAAKTGQTIRLGVYTRNELTTIARQKTAKNHYTRAVHQLERALKGKG